MNTIADSGLAAAAPSAEALAMIDRLLGFPTVSRDSNLALIEFVRDYLAGLGVACELDYNSAGSKANLFATIGPTERGGVLLSGHSDVVPVDGQAWTVAPFSLSERDGKLYGRGTADMKGYLASVLAAVPLFLASPLRRPVHLAFSYDEEVGCLGVRSLLEQWGCEVITALSEPDLARQVALDSAVADLLIVDYHLDNDRNGLEAVGSINTQRHTPLPALMITANYSVELKQQVRDLGHSLLHKPVRPMKLKAAMSHLMERGAGA